MGRYIRRAAVGAGLLGLSGGLVWLAGRFPGAVERWYSLGLYRLSSKAAITINSLFPFSVAEWAIILSVALLAAILASGIGRALRAPERLADWWKGLLSGAVLAAGIVGLLFLFTGGLNYYRYTFTHYSGLEVRPSTAEELAGLCAQLVEEANALAGQVPRAGDGGMALTHDLDELGSLLNTAYYGLGRQYGTLLQNGVQARPKGVLCSPVMSYSRITGGFFFFTGEANINTAAPQYSIPATAAHELAHVCGFMREDEANYLAYLACMESQDTQVRYSGLLLALVHASNALHAADRELYAQVMEPLSPLVWREFRLNNAYWDRYETDFGDFSEAVNDTYLKANDQSDGLKSYGRMVDLMLARYRLELEERP